MNPQFLLRKAEERRVYLQRDLQTFGPAETALPFASELAAEVQAMALGLEDTVVACGVPARSAGMATYKADVPPVDPAADWREQHAKKVAALKAGTPRMSFRSRD